MRLSYTVFQLFVERRKFCLRGVYLEPLLGVIPHGPQLRRKRRTIPPEFWVRDSNANCLTRTLSYTAQNSPIHAISNNKFFFCGGGVVHSPDPSPGERGTPSSYLHPSPPTNPSGSVPASPRIPDCRFAPMVTVGRFERDLRHLETEHIFDCLSFKSVAICRHDLRIFSRSYREWSQRLRFRLHDFGHSEMLT